MALSKAKFNEIPSDAVVLSEPEALAYQMKIMQKWKKTSDVFAFRYGSYFLGGASFFTGMFLNTHFRTKFKLYNYGKFATYLPMCILPAVFTAMFHVEFIVKDVLLLNKDQCPICLEMRAASLQSLLGVGFPLVLGPVATISLALKYGTYNLPDITKEPRKVFSLLQKTMRPISTMVFAFVVGHALLGSVVTYLESKSVITVIEKLDALHKKVENS